jgi:hypothetical protein
VERQVTPDGGMPSSAVDIAVRAHTSTDEPAAGVATLIRIFSHRPVSLRRRHDSIAALLERLADDLLRLAA